MKKFLLFLCTILSACDAPDLTKEGRISASYPDKHGVVCYTTEFRGEFSCVKVQ